MALLPENVRPVSPDPFINSEEDMMLIKLGHYKALVTALRTAEVDVATAQADATQALADAAAAVRPYTSYTATLAQSGTGAPVATVMENSLGAIVWARSNTGNYTATLTGAFTTGQTFTMIVASTVGTFTFVRASANALSLKTYDGTNTIADNQLQDSSIEIRVYD